MRDFTTLTSASDGMVLYRITAKLLFCKNEDGKLGLFQDASLPEIYEVRINFSRSLMRIRVTNICSKYLDGASNKEEDRLVRDYNAHA